MASEQCRKRQRDDDNDGIEKNVGPSGRAAAGEQQETKRRRVGTVTFGLGAFAGLVGKAFRATAAVFGRGGQQQR